LPHDAMLENPQSTWWQRLIITLYNFVASFTRDYEGMVLSGNELRDEETYKYIDVWVARGREWGELLQLFADDDFTPNTGINVRVNILPAGSVGVIGGVSPLMLSIVTSNAPDIALGGDFTSPVELAIRGAAQDLSIFEGFSDISGRFLPGALTPFEYNDGVYALPETMDLPIMIYRTDITSQLGIEIPQTWEELYSKVLPVINQNNMHFFMTPNFGTFLFQNGGQFFSADGLSTALNSDVAYRAFLQWTRNYTIFRMMPFANLFNHFRMGSIPVAIANLQDYVMLKVAAPELFGRWSVASIPGTIGDNGGVDRSAGGSVTSAMMFAQSSNKDYAWEFLKWWTSSDVQHRYALEIESLIGAEARWFSANTDAFISLPWDLHDLNVIVENFPWFRNPPNVLGGYMTHRHLTNAWTRTVMNNVNPRDSFERAIRDITAEMERKQERYDDKRMR